MRSTTWRAMLAALAALLLLTAAACGDDADDAAVTTEDDAEADEDGTDEDGTDEDGTDERPAATGSTGAFCAQIEAADAAFDSLDGMDVAFDSDAFDLALRTLSAIDPPGEISADWARIVTALEEMAAVFDEVDLSDPQSLAALEEDEELMARLEALEARFEDLDEAGDRVADYVRDECGIDLDD
jgi:hypothetical protein